ncbi:MAG: anthranilate phosphoribosyltransferase [Acetobacteraceae bacterium]|nr:anthranilate phosphoribosyltransferase [Acetobacteraceae bacterium]
MPPPGGLKPVIARLAGAEHLSEAEAEAAFGLIMEGEATPAQMAALLMAMRVRGESVPEMTGAARAMRARMLAIEAPPGAIDTCGTGGDASGTWNISTAAALVIAACGVPVAKHGNRAASSRSGSADVLAALGVVLDAPIERVERALEEANIAFLMAPRHHSAMRHVAGVRVELGTRTLFNLLGPLCNPARVRYQVMGVFARDWLVPIAEAFGRLGSERVWVMHGADGLDELSTTGATHVAELRDGRVGTFTVQPEDAGIARTNPALLKGGEPDENAAALRAVLAGESGGSVGAYRDIVALNAAAALVVAGRAGNLREGAHQAFAALDSGAAASVLERLVAITRGEDA